MFRIFGIPVIFNWIFFATLALLGGAFRAQGPEAWLDVGLFVLAGTVSILVHEFGHAMVGRKLGGGNPVIHLHALGGLCSFERSNFSRKQDFMMVAAGPLAGFALALLMFLALMILPDTAPPKIHFLIFTTCLINVVWSIINLLPVLPMDGGRLVQAALGPQRLRATLIIGIITTAVCIPFAIKSGFILMPILLVWFAWQNIKVLMAIQRASR